MNWTTPDDIKAQVRKLWDQGLLLASLAGGEVPFPRRMAFRGPGSRDLSVCFGEVKDWIARLSEQSGLYRIEWRGVNHRVIGNNRIPAAIWVDSLEDALGLIGKRRDADRFATLVARTRELRPELIPWLAKRPLRALELEDDWTRLLAITSWLLGHPRPGVYLRQINLPGVHSKFVEAHRGVLDELLNLLLPPDAIDANFTGVGGFCRRYGFREKPERVRFRALSAEAIPALTGPDRDVTLTGSDFAALNPPANTVFITENEINFLGFPSVSNAIVLFGAGYGFGSLADASWLKTRRIHYWGDLDTHGFAILNQLRELFPHTVSFLMDERTLLAHRPFWETELRPERGELHRLNVEEHTLYCRLRDNHWGDRVRLEQERIGFDFLTDALKNGLK